MTQQNSPQIYGLLTQIRWSGIYTKSITWGWEVDRAVAILADFEDAAMFVHGYLDYGRNPAFKHVDTDETRELRGRLREELLPKRSLVDQVEMPDRQRAGTPVVVKIPFEVLQESGLRNILEMENRVLGARANRLEGGPSSLS
jgi:hypothetical protein